jgi:glycosyltransferase involved in cell wall biosynthesis
VTAGSEGIPQNSLFLPAPEWAAALAALRARRERLDRHAALAEALERAGDAEAAVGIVGAAAALAGTEHTGVQSSARLEAVLERIAADRLPPLARPAPAPDGRRRVLHVVTEVYPTGGHGRVLWRWMDREPGSVHSVVATCQVNQVAEGVVAMAGERGGQFVRLDPTLGAVDRAAELRRLAGQADVIVVHQHPHDPVPTLALAAAPDRPPVVVFNHADHMFWLGASIADVLLSIRELGPLVGRDGRGIPGDRHVIRAFPVSGADGSSRDPAQPVGADERRVARQTVLGRLGWPDDTVLIATVGSEYKYKGPAGSRLIDLVEPVLADLPQARLVAVGPGDTGAWLDARAGTGGRVAALGELPDVGPILLAADIYLDSRPLGGQAASAEGAAAGLPALTYAATTIESQVTCPDPIYGAIVLDDVDEYRGLLRSLIADPERRRAVGEAARVAVAEADAGWGDVVEEVYTLAAELGPMSVAQLEPLAAVAGPREAVVNAFVTLNRGLAPDAVDRIAAIVELAGRSAAVRRLFSWTSAGPGYPQQRLRYAAAFAAPAADPEALTAVIEEFRSLARASVAQTYVLALRPEDADAAVPVLEAAIAAGEDIDVDLQLVEDPQLARPEGALLVAADVAPGPETHRIAGGPAAP